MSKKASLLWVDLEMTGLSPTEDRILEVAAIATLSELTRETIDSLDVLAPFGQGNKRPLLGIRSVFMRNRTRVGYDAKHLRFIATDGMAQVPAIMFRAPDMSRAYAYDGIVDLVVDAVNETWQGRTNPKLMVQDICYHDSIRAVGADAVLMQLCEHLCALTRIPDLPCEPDADAALRLRAMGDADRRRALREVLGGDRLDDDPLLLARRLAVDAVDGNDADVLRIEDRAVKGGQAASLRVLLPLERPHGAKDADAVEERRRLLLALGRGVRSFSTLQPAGDELPEREAVGGGRGGNRDAQGRADARQDGRIDGLVVGDVVVRLQRRDLDGVEEHGLLRRALGGVVQRVPDVIRHVVAEAVSGPAGTFAKVVRGEAAEEGGVRAVEEDVAHGRES